jgi:hypothetical protein
MAERTAFDANLARTLIGKRDTPGEEAVSLRRTQKALANAAE